MPLQSDRYRRHSDFISGLPMNPYTLSLTLKTSALSALVAYLGLALTAFVYVPFGKGVVPTSCIQRYFFHHIIFHFTKH